MKLLNDRVSHDLPLAEAEWAAWRQWVGLVREEGEEEEEEEASTSSWCADTSMWAWMRSLSPSVFRSHVSSPYCRSGRARWRQWQWYVRGWVFLVLLFSLCSFLLSSCPRCLTPGPL